ncbi:MAG TPA: RNA 3'-terminal phosphate cyclase [Dehalococcoidia bacterium]|nr:RNA 3'-terminal phosphate cyclase [Dehalococcoidia bacterium]
MIEIDGSLYSGSGTIVRQAVALSALTSQSVHIVNARQRRTKPGLRRQHVRAVEAVSELCSGVVQGCVEGSTELTFHPGTSVEIAEHHWDIGSAGSTTMLASAVLPVLAFAQVPKEVLIQGGLFQDHAPTYFHVRHVLLPILQRMGIDASIEMIRPGYVPSGGGMLRLATKPALAPLRPLIFEERGDVEKVWGIALSSRLHERSVSQRMAETARRVLLGSGYAAQIETAEDETALQRGAALAVFADLKGGSRIGADRAGAPRRSSEAIGEYVARQLLQELSTGATLDRYAADQVIIYAALADGESRFRIPMVTEHVLASAWLAREFLGAEVRTDEGLITVRGVGFQLRPANHLDGFSRAPN